MTLHPVNFDATPDRPRHLAVQRTGSNGEGSLCLLTLSARSSRWQPRWPFSVVFALHNPMLPLLLLLCFCFVFSLSLSLSSSPHPTVNEELWCVPVWPTASTMGVAQTRSYNDSRQCYTNTISQWQSAVLHKHHHTMTIGSATQTPSYNDSRQCDTITIIQR